VDGRLFFAAFIGGDENKEESPDSAKKTHQLRAGLQA